MNNKSEQHGIKPEFYKQRRLLHIITCRGMARYALLPAPKSMQHRQQHQAQVEAFLQQSFAIRDWTFTLPPGSGNETYFAHTPGESYFVKVGGYPERALALAEAGITPSVLASGHLPDGATIMVQPFVEGRNPQPKDYQDHLEQIAGMVPKMHHDPQVKKTLPSPTSNLHMDGALRALAYVERQWSLYTTHLPAETDFLDKNLVDLKQQVEQLTGAGLVASHGDFCNANMLITPHGKLYIIDLELMSLDDPALDLGAVLWWYFRPKCANASSRQQATKTHQNFGTGCD